MSSRWTQSSFNDSVVFLHTRGAIREMTLVSHSAPSPSIGEKGGTQLNAVDSQNEKSLMDTGSVSHQVSGACGRQTELAR